MDDFRYIRDRDTLTRLCAELAESDWLALDTEFIRESTYQPRLCLVQIADTERIACLDPLEIDDLEPLWQLLYRPGITKVLHAAAQDLEILHGLRGEPPAPVFDTQIAAALVGHGDQVGYARLVERVLGVSLGKAHTRADWSRRPLSEDQLRYAADDVRYLRELYPRLRAELERRGRLDWLTEDFAALTRPERYRHPPEEAWRRIRGAARLKPRQFTALAELAAWREQQAQALDRPRQWLVKDDALLTVARHLPDGRRELERVRDLPRNTIREHGDAILAAVERARQAETPRQPPAERGQHLADDQAPLLDLLMALVRLRAREAGISASLVASRNDVERLLTGERDLDLLRGWRYRVVGAEVLDALAGKLQLRIVAGRLTVEPST